MKITVHTVDDLAQPPAPPPARPRRAGLHPVHAFGATYGMMIAGIAILLREVVLRTGGNEAGSIVVMAGTVLIALLAGVVVVSLSEKVGRV
jgi:hypothetical protein